MWLGGVDDGSDMWLAAHGETLTPGRAASFDITTKMLDYHPKTLACEDNDQVGRKSCRSAAGRAASGQPLQTTHACLSAGVRFHFCCTRRRDGGESTACAQCWPRSVFCGTEHQLTAEVVVEKSRTHVDAYR